MDYESYGLSNLQRPSDLEVLLKLITLQWSGSIDLTLSKQGALT